MKFQKKNKNELESKRTTFFLIGLALSLLSVIGFFNLNSNKIQARSLAIPTEYAEFIEIPITKSKKEQKKAFNKQVQTSTEPTIIDDPFEILDEPFSEEELAKSDSVTHEKTITGEKDLFLIVEEMPKFPGGEEKFFEYLSNETRYPRIALMNDIYGIVHVNFIIGRDGSVEEASVIRGIGGGCDEEALRVIKSMPRWSPGKQRGQAVRVQFSIPIQFNLK